MEFTLSVTALLFGVVLIVTAMSILRLSTIPAYFIVGMVAGPSGLAVLHSGAAVDFAAELGIILLLFTIGLKFNIGALNAIRGIVFILGGAQVLTTTLLFSALAWFWLGDVFVATLIGCVAAMSSTAVVSQILIRENIITSATGRRAIGVLLFQDMAVIPLIIVFSGGAPDESFLSLLPLLLLKIIISLAFVLSVGPRLTKIWLDWVAQYGDKDLFVLHVVVVVTLAPILTHAFGLSHALGAFLTGMLIAETLHRHRVEQLIEPFRQLFLGFFFMTLGVLVEPTRIAEDGGTILLLAAILLSCKIPLVYVCARLYKTQKTPALKTALLLGGGGEFGFVLFSVANNSGILPDELFQTLVAANMLALVITPLLWRRADPLVRRLFGAGKPLADAAAVPKHAPHVIVCGFGRTGQAACGILRALRIPFIAMENDTLILRSANSEQVIYGGGDRAEYLLAAGVAKARVLIVTYADQASAALTALTAKKLNRHLHIICKAHTTRQVGALLAAGADEVLVDAHESGLSLAGQCLRQIGAPRNVPIHEIFARARNREDPMFQGEYAGFDVDEAESPIRLVGCKVPEVFAGKSLAELTQGASVVNWRRADEELDVSDETKPVRGGDELILSGDDENLERIREQLTAGGEGPEEEENI